jgi:cell division protein FtsB
MPAPRHRSRPAVWRRSRLWIVALAGVCLVAYLYYRPVKSYMSASHQLSQRQAEVKELAREKRLLERRLADSGTGQALLEEARRLGYVRPGERLFVVRGVKEWLAARAAKAAARH